MPRPQRCGAKFVVPVADQVRVTFLGGLGEIGRNCAAIEQDGRIVVVDAGLMFPEPNMYGVDLILPDFRWLIERKDKIDGIVLTHGHGLANSLLD